jgi:hypothetical protein
MRRKSQVATGGAEEPIATGLRKHHFEVLAVHAIGATDALGFAKLRPLDHPATFLAGQAF